MISNYDRFVDIKEWADWANTKMRRFFNNRDHSSLLLKDLRPNLKKNKEFMEELMDSDSKRLQRIYHSIYYLIDSTASSLSGLEGIGIST